MKYTISILSIVFLLLNGNNYMEVADVNDKPAYKINPLLLTDFKSIRDTLYTLKDHIVEINLITHTGKIKFRNGQIKEFPISGGTKNIEDGIETNQGLFVLHWKSKKQYSVQFDSTALLYWMGFNGGIGFHALNGTGYYKYLGKKNVSHGCIRVSREDGEELFNILEKGTPIVVSNGNQAIEIAFSNSVESYKHYSYIELRKIIPNRLSSLYNGKYLITKAEKLLIDEENVSATGLSIGNIDNIPTKQLVPANRIFLTKQLNEKEKWDIILPGTLDLNTMLTLHPLLDPLYARK